MSRLPEGMIARSIIADPDLAMIRTENSNPVVADLVKLLDTAIAGSRPFQGEAYEVAAPLAGDDGAVFQRDAGDRLFAHPPWKIRQPATGSDGSAAGGTGTAYLRYTLDLPKEARLTFMTDVALRSGAVGQPNSDGVLFRVAARAGQDEHAAEVFQASDAALPLTLDLTQLSGRRIELELSVDPGPKRSPSFDWSLWIRPRIEADRALKGTLSVSGGPGWHMAVGPQGMVPLSGQDSNQSVETVFPGTVYLLAEEPKAVELPWDVATAPRQVFLLDQTGQQWNSPPTAGAGPGEST
ncbi:MAG: hypothetical protein ACYC6Y_32045, partial [Thermoguttaceae bacterium]